MHTREDQVSLGSIIKDALFSLKELPYLLDILNFEENKRKDEFCEEQFLIERSLQTFGFDTIKRVFFGFFFEKNRVYPSEARYQKGDWYYINGIMTDTEMAFKQREILENFFQRNIDIFHRPSRGIITDVIRAAFVRTFDHDVSYVERLKQILRDNNEAGRNTVFITHSDGSNLLIRAIESLIGDGYKLRDESIEHYSFGGAMDEDEHSDSIYSEYFGNEKDIISRISIGRSDLSFMNSKFIRKGAKGHMLISSYIIPFLDGKFGKESRLNSYLV